MFIAFTLLFTRTSVRKQRPVRGLPQQRHIENGSAIFKGAMRATRGLMRCGVNSHANVSAASRFSPCEQRRRRGLLKLKSAIPIFGTGKSRRRLRIACLTRRPLR